MQHNNKPYSRLQFSKFYGCRNCLLPSQWHQTLLPYTHHQDQICPYICPAVHGTNYNKLKAITRGTKSSENQSRNVRWPAIKFRTELTTRTLSAESWALGCALVVAIKRSQSIIHCIRLRISTLLSRCWVALLNNSHNTSQLFTSHCNVFTLINQFSSLSICYGRELVVFIRIWPKVTESQL